VWEYWQHQDFLPFDQALTQLSLPAAQSYVEADTSPLLLQPRPWMLQHQDFLSSLQSASQLGKPSAQLKGSTGPTGPGFGGVGGSTTPTGGMTMQPMPVVLQQ